LSEAGHEVDDCDLYASGFNPVMTPPERRAHNSPNPDFSAVNPDRALRKVARERSWPQLTFRQTEAAGSLALAGPPVA